MGLRQIRTIIVLMVMSLATDIYPAPLDSLLIAPQEFLRKQVSVEGYAASPDCYQIENGGCSGAPCTGELVLQQEESGGPAIIIFGSYNGARVSCESDGCLLKAFPLDLGVKYRVWGTLKETGSPDKAKSYALDLDSFAVVDRGLLQSPGAVPRKGDKLEVGNGIERTVFVFDSTNKGIWFTIRSSRTRVDFNDPVDTLEHGYFSGTAESGIWVQYFPNKKIRAQGKFIKGARDSLWMEFDSPGNRVSAGFYSSGHETGIWKRKIQGSVVDAQFDYQTPGKIIETTFGADSNKAAVMTIDRFTQSLEKASVFYPGNKKKRFIESDSKTGSASTTEWLPSGVRVRYFSVKNGRFIDSIWYPSGKLWKIKTFDLAGNVYPFVELYENGATKWSGAFKGANPVGVWTEYGQTGGKGKEVAYNKSNIDTMSGAAKTWSLHSVTNGESIQSILVTDSGVWTGTNGGVVRYTRAGIVDGYYTTADGLPGNHVTTISRDRSGALWFGAEQSALDACPEGSACCVYIMGSPIAKLSSANGLFGNAADAPLQNQNGLRSSIGKWYNGAWSYYETVADSTYLPPITSLTASADGSLWYTSLNGVKRIGGPLSDALQSHLGLCVGNFAALPDSSVWGFSNDSVFRVKNDSITAYKCDAASGLPLALHYAPDHHLYLLAQHALFRANRGSLEKQSVFPSITVNDITSFDIEPSGAVVFASDQGLVSVTGGKQTVIAPRKALGGEKVTCFARDSSDFWIGTRHGLYRLSKGKITRLQSPDGPETGNTTLISAGHHGAACAWVLRKGLFAFHGSSWQCFDSLGHDPLTDVQTLAAGRDSGFFIGTTQGLYVKTGIRSVNLARKNRLASGSITSAIVDNSGIVRYVKDGGTIVSYNGSTFAIEHENITALDGQISALLVDKKGAVWFADRSGITVVEKDKSTRSYSAANGLPIIPVIRLFEDNAGTIYALSIRSAYRLDGDRWNSLVTEDNVNGSRITSMAQTKNNALWIGTNDGLCLFEKGTDGFRSIRTGLLDKKINDLSVDADGTLWVATEMGVSKVTFP